VFLVLVMKVVTIPYIQFLLLNLYFTTIYALLPYFSVHRRVENDHDDSTSAITVTDSDTQGVRGGHSAGDIDMFENGPSGGDEFAAVKVCVCVCVCV
jgi:hypothetical protein